MVRVREQREPEDSVIARNISGKIDYMDCFCIDIKRDHAVTADYLAVKLFAFSPGWIRFLVKIRNILVKPFGISTVTDHEPEEAGINYCLTSLFNRR